MRYQHVLVFIVVIVVGVNVFLLHTCTKSTPNPSPLQQEQQIIYAENHKVSVFISKVFFFTIEFSMQKLHINLNFTENVSQYHSVAPNPPLLLEKQLFRWLLLFFF